MESVPKERIPQTPVLSAHPPFETPQAGCGWENRSVGLVLHFVRGVFRSLRRAIKTKVKLIFPCGGRENQRGIPDSAESGQPARLDRAGSQTRTRLSPVGGSPLSLKSTGAYAPHVQVDAARQPELAFGTVSGGGRGTAPSSEERIRFVYEKSTVRGRCFCFEGEFRDLWVAVWFLF